MNYGRYEIVQELGKGAMGVVYQAQDPQINRTIALKVLREDRVTSEDFVQRFLKEAMAIGRLSHPNIVTIYDVGRDHGTVYLAMEFLEGRPFNDIIRESTLSAEQIAELAIQLADSLDYAHKKGIVHRDIKPSNIMMTPDGKVKLTDFGIARIEDASMHQQTRAGEILGTPVYMSPEQVMGQQLDGRSDLYSLGVILYELAAGSRPYSGENLASIFRAITLDNPKDPAEINPGMPPGLGKLIMKSLNKKADDRFQTGSEMAAAFRDFLREMESVGEPKVSERRKIPYTALIAAIAVIILFASGALYFSSREKVSNSSTSMEQAVELASVKVESMPIGAQIFVDGSFKGKTPQLLDIPLGKHEVRLSLPEYYDWEAQLQLEGKEEVPLFVRLVPTQDQGN
ncbi:MAG: serine/threonine protein kinase [Deltaproteobacteria bacterium]|nr:serine/threonine protein kinase [Deltaproteobacteria bacterium]